MVQISLLAIAVLLLALAIFVWRARPEAPTHRWFAVFTLAVANWTIGVAGLQSGSHLDLWGRFTFASAALIPAASLAFIYRYPAQNGWPTSIVVRGVLWAAGIRSEEHTSELQSRLHLVCRLLLEKKKQTKRPGPPLTTLRRNRVRDSCAGGAPY